MDGRSGFVYFEEKRIAFSDCDFTGRMKLSALLRYTSDLAGNDYADRGMNWEFLQQRGVAFLVSSVRMRIHRPIMEEESVTFSTYERGIKGPICLRDTFVEDAAGNRVVSIRAAWVLCDPVKRRILRPDTDRLPKPIESHWDMPLECDDPARIRLSETMQDAGERKIVYSDLDANGHVNNSVYADIACDSLPLDVFRSGISEFSVFYHQEATLGDRLAMTIGTSPGRVAVRGKNGDAVCFELEAHGNF